MLALLPLALLVHPPTAHAGGACPQVGVNAAGVVDHRGVAFEVVFGDLVFVEPSNVDLLFASVDPTLLIQALRRGAANTALEIGIAPTDLAAPDRPDCPLASVDPDADYGTPNQVRFGPMDVEIPLDLGTTMLFLDLTGRGRYRGDGTALENLEIQALLDVESLGLGLPCDLLAILVAGTCVPCASADDCLFFESDPIRPASAAIAPCVDLVGECAL